jgi:hypothetical protein
MPTRRVILAGATALFLAAAAPAQVDLSTRLSAGRIGDVQTGAFSAGDSIRFTLVRNGSKYLLRFDRDPETYVLTVDHGSLGGRVLRYDTGATALQVAGWSAMTVYPDSEPSGLPAERTGDAQPLETKPLSAIDLRRAAGDESAHLAYLRGVHIDFEADWAALDDDVALRRTVFDAMQNVARGIERFTANAKARAALLGRLATVKIERGQRSSVALHGKVLDVAVDSSAGAAGRPSSRAIARTLGSLMAVPTAG